MTSGRIFEDRLDDAPLRIDNVLPAEQFAVAAHRVTEQALIGRRQRAGLFAHDQFDIFADHPLARPLHAQADRDGNVRAEPHAEIAVRKLLAEYHARRLVELHDHFDGGHRHMLCRRE